MKNSNMCAMFKFSSANAFKLIKAKVLSPSKGLTLSKTSPCFLRVLNKSLENTVGKGGIARNEQFLLFPKYFLPVWRTFCHFL